MFYVVCTYIVVCLVALVVIPSYTPKKTPHKPIFQEKENILIPEHETHYYDKFEDETYELH